MLIRTILSRTTAHGAKWKKWYNGQRRWLGTKCIPHRHRNYKLISMEAVSSFEVNKCKKEVTGKKEVTCVRNTL